MFFMYVNRIKHLKIIGKFYAANPPKTHPMSTDQRNQNFYFPNDKNNGDFEGKHY